jgi:hypothetical protein
LGYEVQSALTNRSPAGRAVISVQPSGVLRMNLEATELLKELNAVRVLLLWDSEKRKIAVAPAAKNDSRSYKLSYDSKKRSAQFAAKATIKNIGWYSDKSVRIPVHVVDKMLEGILPAEYLGGARTRKKKPDP